MPAPTVFTSVAGATAGPADIGTKPLNDGEWTRFWELLAQPRPSLEGMSDEQKKRASADYAELAALHDKAQDYIDGWKPDAKVTAWLMANHALGVISLIERFAALLPAAGGMTHTIAAAKAAAVDLAVALRGPTNIPPMPEPPDGYARPGPGDAKLTPQEAADKAKLASDLKEGWSSPAQAAALKDPPPPLPPIKDPIMPGTLAKRPDPPIPSTMGTQAGGGSAAVSPPMKK